jgi:preprotein translocase subunit SecA
MKIVNSLLKVFLGDKKSKDIKQMQPLLDKVNAFADELQQIGLDELRNKTQEFRSKLKEATKDLRQRQDELRKNAEEETNLENREKIYDEIDKLEDEIYEIEEKVLNDILPEAFAVVRETARRFKDNKELEVTTTPLDRELSATRDYITVNDDKTIWKNSWNAEGKEVVWDMVHYDVQILGGIVLHQGKIAEMMTGEGKTLVATLPLYLNALPGRGAHLVTVNDYLAKRDAAWMGPIFEFLGLRVDCIDRHQPNTSQRRKAYEADITYGTNNEFGFDYLRDNMAHTTEDLVQREHNYAIVDEVDSVLIDDARTPLIISGPVEQGDRHEFNELKPYIERIYQEQKANMLKELALAKKLIKEGNIKEGGFHLLRVYRGLPKNHALIKFLSEEGVKQLLQKTEAKYMENNNALMPEIDKELLFVIDEKNNSIELTDKGVEFLSKDTDPDFFILPNISEEIGKIDKSDDDAIEKAQKKDKLFREYAAKSERLHTLNQLLKAYTLFEKDVEYVVIDGQVKIVDEQTGRIMEGRRYSDGLHQAIEAKENVKIEDATQTYATVTLQNFFRMYRKLAGMTGTAITEAGEFWDIYKLDVVEVPTNKPLARIDKDDKIYKTKREKYNAIIREIGELTKQGRPVLVGTTSVETSELLSKMLNYVKIPHNVLNAKHHKREAEIVAEAGNPGVVTIATNMAGRGTDIKLSDEVVKAGGLAIIGTERHDSRRVDRQLRGRAGRQGDPGSSQFYVSLEDNLMRLFGSEKIAKIMDRMGMKEGDVIQHPMISKSIERAQKKVEENNFGIRKRLLEYDDVMNAQRELVYKRRRHALEGERLKVDIANMIYEAVDAIVEQTKPAKNYEAFEKELITTFSIHSPISKDEFLSMTEGEIINKIFEVATNHYKEKIARTAQIAYPVIKEVYENEGDRYKRIIVPFTDGTREIKVTTDLKAAYESKGEKLVDDFEKNITLAIIDEAWKDHLHKMDQLKTSVQMASYEQKDPVLIYKFEAFELFRNMLDKVNKDVLSFLFKGDLPSRDANQVREARQTRRPKQKLTESRMNNIPSLEEMAANNRQAMQGGQKQEITSPIRKGKTYGRNEIVTLINVNNGEKKEMKYKKAIPLIESGEWVIQES